MKKILLTLLALLPLFGLAQGIDLMQVIPNDTEVRVGTLESGIKYYIRKNSKDPKRANFHIMYDVGAVQELDNQQGLAHFLEHMAFNGSKNFPGKGMDDYLQSIGVHFGENLNAMTGQEMTTYMITNVPITREGIVDSVLLVLHDWAGFIDLKDEDIDDERGVICEEWRQGNNAQRRVLDKQMETLLPGSIYAKRNVIGTEEVILSFTYEDLRSFYRKWYRPDMQAFVIVGDFDVDEMEAKLKKTMADIKEFEVKTPKDVVVITDKETPSVSIVTDPELKSTDVSIIFRHKPIAKKYADRVIALKQDIMTGLISSMLNERFTEIARKENAPFLDAGCGYFNFVEPADVLYVSGSARNDETVQTLEAVYTELLRMQRGGFTNSEFERVKTNHLTRAERAYNNRNDRRNGDFVDDYMSNFTSNSPFPSAETQFELTKEVLASITLDEINAVAKSLVRDKNSAVLVAAPSSTQVPSETQIIEVLDKVKGSEIAVFVEEVNNQPLVDQAAIKAGKVIKVDNGKFESTLWTLSNGVNVVIKKTDFKADEVIMNGVKLGGTSTIENLDDLVSIEFWKYFSGNAGLGNFSSTDLRKALTGKIANASASFGPLTATINGSCSPKDMETMLQLAYLRMAAPRFEQTDLNVVTNQWRSMIPNIIQTPDYAFSYQTNKTITGNNPRAMANLPSMEMLDKVSLERMAAMYKAQFANVSGMTFVFTGNFDEDALRPLVEKYLGSLPSDMKESPKFGKYHIHNVEGKVTNEFRTRMETPKVTSLSIYSGNIEWNDTERINLAAIRHILEVRYTKSVREEAGGTYGVQVQLEVSKEPKQEFGLAVYFNTDESKLNELMPIIQKELDDIVAGKIADESITIYKEFVVKKFAESNISNGTWNSYLREWYVWGNDNYSTYLKAVESVTKESIQATAKRAFSQGNLIKVIQLPQQ